MRYSKLACLSLCITLLTLTSCNKANVTEEIYEESSIEETAISESETQEIITIEETTTKQEINSIYQQIIDESYNFINSNNTLTAERGQIGFAEIVGAVKVDKALEDIGYTFIDINKDGIEELILAERYIDTETNNILAAYTIKDNNPVLLFEGTVRSRFYLLDDNTIYYTGSNGADYSIWGLYKINDTNDDLETIDFYFTEYNEELRGWYWYYNNTSRYYKSESTCVAKTHGEIENKMDGYYSRIQKLDLTFFDTYK